MIAFHLGEAHVLVRLRDCLVLKTFPARLCRSLKRDIGPLILMSTDNIFVTKCVTPRSRMRPACKTCVLHGRQSRDCIDYYGITMVLARFIYLVLYFIQEHSRSLLSQSSNVVEIESRYGDFFETCMQTLSFINQL